MTAHYVKGLHDPTAGSCKVFCSFSWGHKHIMAPSDRGCPDWTAISPPGPSFSLHMVVLEPAGKWWLGRRKQCESMSGFSDVEAEFHNSYVQPCMCWTTSQPVLATQASNFHLWVSKATLRVYLYRGPQRSQENLLSSHPSGLRTEEAPPLTLPSSLAVWDIMLLSSAHDILYIFSFRFPPANPMYCRKEAAERSISI